MSLGDPCTQCGEEMQPLNSPICIHCHDDNDHCDRFFEKHGDTDLTHPYGHDTVTVEEMYQCFKQRFIKESKQ